MSKSILCTEKRCWVCQTTKNLHKHHVYAGGRRRISDREGCWVWLCAYHHTASDVAVHRCPNADRWLKMMCQAAWEKKNGGDRDEFIRLFGKSYIVDRADETAVAE